MRHSTFDSLRAQELRNGFHERPATAASFFREGKSGGWRNVLSREQVDRIVQAHEPVMRRFGYYPFEK
jgi:hypothetical protein